MLIFRIWNYFRGYVIIRIEGLSLERFINMCIAKGIYLWDIKRVNYTAIDAKVGIKGFKEMRRLKRRANCKIYISQKYGYPFLFSKAKKRKMLLLGAFFSLLVLIVCTSFIFTIEINGNERISNEDIIQALSESGFKSGANRYFTDLREIENNLLLSINDLAWVGIEIKGINAKVNVVEKSLAPPKIDKNTPCNIIASKRGVIEKIVAKSGDAIVKKGDIVMEGELLITGIINKESIGDTVYVHAYGEVYAKTYYEIMKQMNLIQVIKEKTGKQFSTRQLNIGSLKVSLGRGEIPYDIYILEKQQKSPFGWRNKRLPVEIVLETYYEAIEIEKEVNIGEAKTKLHQDSINELAEEIPADAKIINTKTNFTIKDNILYSTVIIEALEDIAIKQKIVNVEGS